MNNQQKHYVIAAIVVMLIFTCIFIFMNSDYYENNYPSVVQLSSEIPPYDTMSEYKNGEVITFFKFVEYSNAFVINGILYHGTRGNIDRCYVYPVNNATSKIHTSIITFVYNDDNIVIGSGNRTHTESVVLLFVNHTIAESIETLYETPCVVYYGYALFKTRATL